MNDVQYIPGICNIGAHEIRLKWVYGWIGLMLTVIFLIVCVQLSLSPLVRVFVFFPALFAVQGFVQALLGFCFTFGFMSIADFGTTSHDRKKITVSEFQTQDKVRASGVLVMCVAIAGVITALVYYFL